MPDDDPKAPDDLQSAKLVYEHVKMLWDDQVELAEGLVEKRKTFSAMLAILVGLGIFRVQLTTRPDEVPALEGELLTIVVLVLTLALCAFGAGAYLLYTQRPTCRRVLHWLAHSIRRHAVYLWQMARTDPPNAHKLRPAEAPPSPWPAGRVLEKILPDAERLEDWMVQPPIGVIHRRTIRLREAYKSLRDRNDRVARRLREALFFLFAGYGLVFLALGVYLWSRGGWIS